MAYTDIQLLAGRAVSESGYGNESRIRQLWFDLQTTSIREFQTKELGMKPTNTKGNCYLLGSKQRGVCGCASQIENDENSLTYPSRGGYG